jgi:hypothetical protein
MNGHNKENFDDVKPVLEALTKYSKNPWVLGDGINTIGYFSISGVLNFSIDCFLSCRSDVARSLEVPCRIQLIKFHKARKGWKNILIVDEYLPFADLHLPLLALSYLPVMI